MINNEDIVKKIAQSKKKTPCKVILNKVKNYHSSDVEINLTITGCNNKISS